METPNPEIFLHVRTAHGLQRARNTEGDGNLEKRTVLSKGWRVGTAAENERRPGHRL